MALESPQLFGTERQRLDAAGAGQGQDRLSPYVVSQGNSSLIFVLLSFPKPGLSYFAERPLVPLCSASFSGGILTKPLLQDETQQVQEHWHLGQPLADEHCEVGGRQGSNFTLAKNLFISCVDSACSYIRF